jgi:GNAT superfamily N-acetyltransferase
MFDVQLADRQRHVLAAEVPGIDEPWTIGTIVGPSGSGKTTLARAAFGKAIYERRPWPTGRAMIDCLGEHSIREITRVLTAVGLGSVPTWIKPYEVLSTGEKSRADLCRALLGGGQDLTQRRKGGEQVATLDLRASAPPREKQSVVVFDEFTSTLDRTVAKTLSAALARLLRYGAPRWPRFVAVTCHTDILSWLRPDWVLDLGDQGGPPRLCYASQNTGTPSPTVNLRIERVQQAMWQHFAPHHYLSGGLAASATCYGAFWEGEAPAEPTAASRLGGSLALPVAFCAVVAALGWRKTKRIARLVVLPQFQGLGVGSRLAEEVATRAAERGNRVTITASHPAIVSHCSHSPKWRYLGLKKNGSTRQRMGEREIRSSIGRAVASFEFVAEG